MSFEVWKKLVDELVRCLVNAENTDVHGFDFDYETHYVRSLTPEEAACICAQKLMNEGWCY